MKPRRANGRENFPEWPVAGCISIAVVSDGFHVVDRRIREVRMVPNIEEIGCETRIEPLGQSQVFREREIPVLLARPPESIAAEVALSGGAEVGILNGVAGRGWIQEIEGILQRSGSKLIDVQITVQSMPILTIVRCK
jgi:hypothetical protein